MEREYRASHTKRQPSLTPPGTPKRQSSSTPPGTPTHTSSNKRHKLSFSPRVSSTPLSPRRNNRVTASRSIASAVRYSKYAVAFRKILRRGEAARRAFDKVVEQHIRRQMNQYARDHHQEFPQFTGTKSLGEFCWSDLMSQLSGSLPTLYAAMRGAMPKKIVNDKEKFT